MHLHVFGPILTACLAVEWYWVRHETDNFFLRVRHIMMICWFWTVMIWTIFFRSFQPSGLEVQVQWNIPLYWKLNIFSNALLVNGDFLLVLTMSGSFIPYVPFIRLDRLFGLFVVVLCFVTIFLPIFHHFSFEFNDNRYYFQPNDLAYFSCISHMLTFFLRRSPRPSMCGFFIASSEWIKKNTKQKVDSRQSFATHSRFFNRSIIHFCCMISTMQFRMPARLLHAMFE